MSQNPLLAPIYPIDQHPEFLKLNEIDRENLLQVSFLYQYLIILLYCVGFEIPKMDSVWYGELCI